MSKKWQELKVFINQLLNTSDIPSEDLYLIKEKMQQLEKDNRFKPLPNNFGFVANEYFNKKLSLEEASQQVEMSKSTFLRRLTQNGFRETRKRYKYIVVSDYSNKEYQKQEDLLKDVGISHKALNRYFNGKGRLIKQLGIKIKKQEVM